MKKILFYLAFVSLLVSCETITQKEDTPSDEAIIIGQEYVELADEYIDLEEYEKALEMYQKARETNTIFNEQISFDIARTAALANNWQVAILEYKNLLNLDPTNITIQKSLAWIYAQSGDLQEAQKQYASLYEQYSFDTHIATNYILVLHANNETELAKTIFTSYAQMYPDADNLESLNKTLEKDITD